MSIEDQFITDVNTLVPRPDIALKVMSLAHEQECNIAKLAELIQHDPSLTANMLRLANSAYFGHMKEIKSITDIVVRLGLETVKIFAITGASAGFLRTPQDAYNLDPEILWKHSYATALLSSIIASHAHCDDVSGVYSAALLHDIGKVILNKPLLLETHNHGTFWKGGDISEYERSMLGTDHARVGEALLVKWGLPRSISRPIALHHRTTTIKNEDVKSQIIYSANLLTENMGINAAEPDMDFIDIINDNGDLDLPDIPNLATNMENIIEEFIEKFTNS